MAKPRPFIVISRIGIDFLSNEIKYWLVASGENQAGSVGVPRVDRRRIDNGGIIL